jgi:hypothetical protein
MGVEHGTLSARPAHEDGVFALLDATLTAPLQCTRFGGSRGPRSSTPLVTDQPPLGNHAVPDRLSLVSHVANSWARTVPLGAEGTIARLDWRRLRVDHGEKAALLLPVAPLGAEGASWTHLLRVSRLRQIPRSHPGRTADLLVLRLSAWPHRTAFPPKHDSGSVCVAPSGSARVAPGSRAARAPAARPMLSRMCVAAGADAGRAMPTRARGTSGQTSSKFFTAQARRTATVGPDEPRSTASGRRRVSTARPVRLYLSFFSFLFLSPSSFPPPRRTWPRISPAGNLAVCMFA